MRGKEKKNHNLNNQGIHSHCTCPMLQNFRCFNVSYKQNAVIL